MGMITQNNHKCIEGETAKAFEISQAWIRFFCAYFNLINPGDI